MDITLETLCAAQRGDHDAQSELMSGLYTAVYHFLLKRTGSNDAADELCQTVFLKCYQRLNHYDQSRGTVYTWVFTIARHTLFDYFKKCKDESLEDPEHVVAEDTTSQADHQAITRINEAHLKKLLDTLDDEEADVVAMRAINEMPYVTMANVINKKESATRKVYARAIKKLRAIVTDNNQYE